MYSIGQLSEITNVKVPTIRFYESKGLLMPTLRSEGNQRRFSKEDADKLSFIKHARDLGLGLESIKKLIDLHNHPEKNCRNANQIAENHLTIIREKIKKLKKLEKELSRIVTGCRSNATVKECYVIRSLSDHKLCENEKH